MNYIQFATFFFYACSVWIAGVAIYEFICGPRDSYINRMVYAGETFLLGSILTVGELMVLSLVGLYKTPFIWGAVCLNFLLICNAPVRKNLFQRIFSFPKPDAPTFIFMALLAMFVFRNCYFLVDVDSHETYLFTQKLWLATGSSLQGGVARNTMTFFPQFDSVPYALGISLFGSETLFPQLVNLSWRLMVLFLVFGYISFRFTRFHGLAAAMLILFNDHFFFSGANQPVIINGAVTALLFAAAYNFWESRNKGNTFRLFLALMFSVQVMANKYQTAYALFLMYILAFVIQQDLKSKIREIALNKKWLLALAVSLIFASLWYLKNWIITGVPTFPVLAGRLHIYHWIPEQEAAFLKVFGGLSPLLFLKYMNYLFTWPGVNPAKYVIMAISFLPLIMLWVSMKKEVEKSETFEFSFWLGLSVLVIGGQCIASHWDPRYYRYYIGILSVSTIFSLSYILKNIVSLKNQIVIGIVCIFIALPGYQIMFAYGDPYKRPTFAQNLGVIQNKIHFRDIVGEYYPKNVIALEGFEKNKEKALKSAWDIGVGGITPLSAFLLPIRPQIGLWKTSAVRWNSYENEASVMRDLKEQGIDYVMRVQDNDLVFLSLEDYAKYAVTSVAPKRFPKYTFYNYNFPEELTKTGY